MEYEIHVTINDCPNSWIVEAASEDEAAREVINMGKRYGAKVEVLAIHPA